MSDLEKLLEKNKAKAEKSKQASRQWSKDKNSAEIKHSLGIAAVLILSIIVTYFIYVMASDTPSLKDKPGRYKGLSAEQYQRLKAWDSKMN